MSLGFSHFAQVSLLTYACIYDCEQFYLFSLVDLYSVILPNAFSFIWIVCERERERQTEREKGVREEGNKRETRKVFSKSLPEKLYCFQSIESVGFEILRHTSASLLAVVVSMKCKQTLTI